MLDQVGWYCANTSGPRPAGGLLPNAWGLFDMHGNAAEWVWDGYRADYQNLAASDPVHDVGAGAPRVIRGGAHSLDARRCRSAFRIGFHPSTTGSGRGFRVARSAFPAAEPGSDDAPITLIDPGEETYFGFERGLYPGAQNTMPASHDDRGKAPAAAIQPRDADGNPDPSGVLVLMSAGMSNTSQEFCNPSQQQPLVCRGDEPFIPQALADGGVDHDRLRLVNGARGGHSADYWEWPGLPIYDSIRDNILAPQGLGEGQVQVVWLKSANSGSMMRPSLPDPEADAWVLLAALGNTVRALATRYPNLQQVYLSSRIYGGYASGYTNSPEPWAYETGFAVKWLIAAQIRQLDDGVIDPIAGNLGLDVAPWLAWGPYLWADGTTPRSDGLVWLREDFVEDGIHPSQSGRFKVAAMLMDYFRTWPAAGCWFLAGQDCEVSD